LIVPASASSASLIVRDEASAEALGPLESFDIAPQQNRWKC
jgi:hypothetical protein